MAQLSEKELTKQIIELLRFCGWRPIRTHRPGQWATDPDVSDLIAIPPGEQEGGRVRPEAHIEVKGVRGKLKPGQLAYLADMRDRGRVAFVAESIEQVIEELALPVLIQ